MRKVLLLSMAIVLCISQIWAQQRTITGRVTDDKGNPIVNVSIFIKGSRSGTITKADGTYSINVPPGTTTLVFSSVNMIEQEVNIANQSSANVTLRPDEKSMTEVVVTGYTRERRSQFVGSASTLTSKAVETVPVG